MAARPLPSPEVLRQLLRYEPNTGRLFWRHRPLNMFSSKKAFLAWNSRYANNLAFTTDNGQGYKQGAIFKRLQKAHRVIWAMQTGIWPDQEIDHKNNDPSDNRWQNLRLATHVENARNRGSRAGSTSVYLGVSWAERQKKWRAEIMISRGCRKYLGYFEDEIAAALAYDAAARAHHGEFARPNFAVRRHDN